VAIDNTNLKLFVDHKSYDDNLLLETLKEIVFLVINRHYNKYIEDTELMSLGLFKAVDLLKSDHVNTNCNIVSFVYSGVRNELGNYIKKENRFVKRSLSFSDIGEEETAVTGRFFAIDSLQKRLSKFSSNFKKLGIPIDVNVQREARGIGREPKGYEKFALKAAFLWEIVG
jgi:hypothetical protein